LALLTPIQEGFLSFLFPFVWQGCYIPILPLHMIEILDAPIPLLVGCHRDYFSITPSSKRPSCVVFVDVDLDKVFYNSSDVSFSNGTNNSVHTSLSNDEKDFFSDANANNNNNINNNNEPSIVLTSLPKNQVLKLKKVLKEVGCCIHKSKNNNNNNKNNNDEILKLKNAGYPFLNHEHFSPIEKFISDQGFFFSCCLLFFLFKI
jgi:hypothetical protein